MILLDPFARPVIGHRGNRAHAPENTIPSFLEAVRLGVDAIELGVQVSRDNQLMVIHDATVDRTTEGSGRVADMTANELRRLDAGARFTRDGTAFPWRSRGAGIATFDEVVDALPDDLPLIVELKTPRASALVKEAIARRGMAARVIVAGFDERSTLPLRGRGIALGASNADVVRLLLPAILGRRVSEVPVQSLCIPRRFRGVPLPLGALLRVVKPHGVTMHIWTVNQVEEAKKLWSRGVNGIITDDPGLILAGRASVECG